jgi:hypothetical protein
LTLSNLWIAVLILNGGGLLFALIAALTGAPGPAAALWACAWFLFVYSSGRAIERIVGNSNPR